MNNLGLSFKDKMKLYYDLAEYFEFELQENKSNQKLESIIIRLKSWGKELKIRKIIMKFSLSLLFLFFSEIIYLNG